MSPFGMAGRKNLVVMKELYLGKILVNLAKKAKEKSKNYSPEELKNYILKVYDLLDNSKDKKYYNLIEKKLSDLIKKKALNKEIEEEHLKFILINEPFNNTIPILNLQKAADLLHIKLDEKIYIPKYEMWTKTEVPTGIKNVPIKFSKFSKSLIIIYLKNTEQNFILNMCNDYILNNYINN